MWADSSRPRSIWLLPFAAADTDTPASVHTATRVSRARTFGDGSGTWDYACDLRDSLRIVSRRLPVPSSVSRNRDGTDYIPTARRGPYSMLHDSGAARVSTGYAWRLRPRWHRLSKSVIAGL